jgi:hypothetical protein
MMRKKTCESDSSRLPNRTTAFSPITDHRTLHCPPPRAGRPNIYVDLFPRALKNDHHERILALTTERHPRRPHTHQPLTNSPLSMETATSTQLQKGDKKNISNMKNLRYCHHLPTRCAVSRLPRCPVPFSLAARPWPPKHLLP